MLYFDQMKFILLIFNLEKIYLKQTFFQIFLNYLIIILIIQIAGFFTENFEGLQYAKLLAYGVVAYFLIRTIVRSFLVNRFLKQNADSVLSLPSSDVFKGSINLELNEIDKLKPVASYGSDKIFIATFDFHRSTKYGVYLAKQAYYTVFEAQLVRRLPHLLFDSKVSKNRQFKSLYLRVQKLSVQGTFDDVFDTYSPQHYHIDILSFVTPEVMEALIGAKQYDIEIINDKLLMYAPLLSIENQQDLALKGRSIADHLNDNIDTYHDNRLSGKERRVEITPFARTLLMTPRKHVITAWIAAVLIIAIVFWALTAAPENRSTILFNHFSLVVYSFFIGSSWQAGKMIMHNKKENERYRMLYLTNRGKPTQK